MSGREDLTDTVPPPEGEDDAYSAATKIGAMPAELLERLRAEGLLPAESDSKSSTSSTYEAAPETARAPDASRRGEGVHVEEARGGNELPSAGAKVGPVDVPAPAPSSPAPVKVEAPVVVHTPPFTSEEERRSQDVRFLENRANKQLMAFVLVGMVLLVAFAFAMALLSQHG